MEAAQFPASAANSLIEGYCDDFVSFASTLAQTLEQVSMRGIEIDKSRASLERLEHGMHQLAVAIHDLLSSNAGLSACAQSGATLGGLPTAAAATSPPGAALPNLAEPAPSEKQPALNKPPPRRELETPKDKPCAPTLKGNNQSMPLLSVCQFIGRMHKNGIMKVTILEEELSFEFVNGYVQHTSSTDCPANERIGAILVAMGFCNDGDLAPVLSQAAKSDEPLGNLILQSELVSHGQLLEALEFQVQLRFSRACKTMLASYEFEEGTCSPTDGRIRITLSELAYQQKQGAD